MLNKINKQKGGYTIIETMIAISLFIVIVMIGMEALLNANLLSIQSQKSRSIMDNMSFIMEDMSRNLRTGYDYHCVDATDSVLTDTAVHSCANGGGISFKSTSIVGGGQWVYYISTDKKIYKSTQGGQAGTFIQLTPDEVAIDSISGFTVLGAEPPLGDSQQPFVIIRLVGTITYQKVIIPFSLQTSVSERQADL